MTQFNKKVNPNSRFTGGQNSNYEALYLEITKDFGALCREGIVANILGTQDDATILDAIYNVIDTVTLNASVKPTKAAVNNYKEITNTGDNPLYLYPQKDERFEINKTLMNIDEPYILEVGNTIRLRCFKKKIWRILI